MDPKTPLNKSTYSPYWMLSSESERSRMLFVNGGLIFVCILLLIMSVILAFGTLSETEEKPIKEQEKMNFIALDNDTEYHFREMIVIDAYTYYENVQTHQVGAQYYLVCFYDRNFELCYASLRVDADSEIRAQCNEYLMNEEAYPGDLVLSGYFSCSDLTELDPVLQTNYKKLMDLYLTEWQGADTGKHFVFDAKTEEALSDLRLETALSGYLGAAALFLGGVAGLVVLILWRKKLNKKPEQTPDLSPKTEISLNGESLEQDRK